MKINRDMILLYMPDCGEEGVLQAWYQGDHSWVEFRGPKYSKWDYTENSYPSEFEEAHDSLLGMHCTVLHQGSVLALLRGKHSDFEVIEDLMTGKNPKIKDLAHQLWKLVTG